MTDPKTVTVQERLRRGLPDDPRLDRMTTMTHGCEHLREAADLLDRCKEALTAARPFLQGLTKQGEDNIWRPAERHLAAFDEVLTQLNGGRNVG